MTESFPLVQCIGYLSAPVQTASLTLPIRGCRVAAYYRSIPHKAALTTPSTHSIGLMLPCNECSCTTQWDPGRLVHSAPSQHEHGSSG